MPSSKNTRHISEDRVFWAALCKKYSDGPKQRQLGFLRAELGVTDGPRNKSAFSRWLKQYKAGALNTDKLLATQTKRQRKTEFDDVEAKLIEYINLRADKFLLSHDKRQKIGLGYIILIDKAHLFAKQLGYSEEAFKGSPGWISSTLKRHNKVGVNLQGEAGEKTDEQAEMLMRHFRDELQALMDKHNVPLEHVYNGDQTGLYYRKMPNRIYVDKEQRKSVRGVKAMKDKERITAMVCTSATGIKVPLAFVGKAKRPRCFQLAPDGKTPTCYMNQANAWFTVPITKWWIWSVLWEHIKKKHGEVHTILILDNCTAHSARSVAALSPHHFPST